jgi:hypothetical protein
LMCDGFGFYRQVIGISRASEMKEIGMVFPPSLLPGRHDKMTNDLTATSRFLRLICFKFHKTNSLEEC